MHRILLKPSQRSFRAFRPTVAAAAAPSFHAASLSTAALVHDDNDDNPFSIRGKFRTGRASYLDMSATTPLDPRVLDKMMPYLVSRYLIGEPIGSYSDLVHATRLANAGEHARNSSIYCYATVIDVSLPAALVYVSNNLVRCNMYFQVYCSQPNASTLFFSRLSNHPRNLDRILRKPPLTNPFLWLGIRNHR